MGLVPLTDEHILDMRLDDEGAQGVVMTLTGVLPPLRPGDVLSFPSFSSWTVVRVGPDLPDTGRVEVTLRLNPSGTTLRRPPRA